MALTDSGNGGGNGMYMPVQPLGNYYGGGYGNGGFGFGGDWAWILLLLLLGGNGWGGFGGFGGGMWPMMMGGAAMGADMGWGLYPWLNNSEHISDGFRDSQLNTNITSVRDGIASLSTQLCNCCGDMQLGMANGFSGVNQGVSSAAAGIQNTLCQGFSGVNAGIANAASQAEISANARHSGLTQQLYNNEINSLNRSFAEQTANAQGFNSVQAQLAQCCCDNKSGIESLRYTVATENCADRQVVSDGIRDVIAAQTANTQAILDKLCALELDNVKGQLAAAQRENVGLQNQLNMATMAASQAAQTATFQQGLNNEVDALYNRLKNCPVNTVPVYGSQPIFTCGGNSGCGCNGGFAN